jgi:hypothetical protein
MIPTPLKWAIAVIAFVLVLMYSMIVTMPERPPTGVEHTAEEAAAECEESVGEGLQEARFPFAATATYLGDARYRLNGTVEADVSGERVRRNYECFVQYTEARRYLTDSLTVWQSH